MAVSPLTLPLPAPKLILSLSPTKFPDIENVMREWLDTVSDDGVVFTDALIRAKARDIADRMGYTEEKFKESSGWVENFKARQGIKKGKLTGSVAARRGRGDLEVSEFSPWGASRWSEVTSRDLEGAGASLYAAESYNGPIRTYGRAPD